MNDLAGKELLIGDLVITNAGYKNNMNFGVVRRVDHNLHLYNLSEYGVLAARKDSGDKTAKGYHKPWYCYGGHCCLKVTADYLPDDDRLKYYNQIMKIISKNVATANNT